MLRSFCVALYVLSAYPLFAAALPDAAAAAPVQATVESSLETARPQIRMLAFDGDATSFYASVNNPTKDDHFTLVLDAPVAIKK